MFIDYVMTICDQILRRAAEQQPGTICLQNGPADNNKEETQNSEETN